MKASPARRLALLVATFALSLGATGAQAQETILKVHHFLAPTSNIHENLIQPWCAKVQKESAGKLKCQLYPAMQLGGTPPQLFDQARDGTVDIVWTVPTYQAGRFMKTEVFEMPFISEHAEKTSLALWEYVQKNALDEYRGVKPLFLHVNDGNLLHMGKAAVRRLEDLKGLKVRAPTRLGTRILAALGATPIQMPVPAVPEAIAKGVVDGAMLPWEVATSLKMQEIAKVHVETPAGHPKISTIVFALLMNQAKYDGLSPELKKVIDANSGLEASRWAGKVADAALPPARKLAQDRGNTFVTLSAEETKRWVDATAPVDDEWVKEVGAKGVNGKLMLDEARAAIRKYQ
ncbi:MAG TPA: TRAP transporter substrate-binding protein [Burkholderiaceae bacterium]|nr:TRAP transporter substrate-binding protein [Burkholderiaceae bacterium]HNB46847.1 TRAP transporter substrate-binding protein [Burkholderiaceae bacterium]HNG82418.1 TRAP transporter substrate-binding protein [Burkholderiaceae bacterium]